MQDLLFNTDMNVMTHLGSALSDSFEFSNDPVRSRIWNERIKPNRKIFYERIGFYIFKIKNKPFLIYYQYLEEIFQKISFSRKRNRKFNPKNSLESLLLKNPNDLIMP